MTHLKWKLPKVSVFESQSCQGSCFQSQSCQSSLGCFPDVGCYLDTLGPKRMCPEYQDSVEYVALPSRPAILISKIAEKLKLWVLMPLSNQPSGLDISSPPPPRHPTKNIINKTCLNPCDIQGCLGIFALLRCLKKP